MNDHDDTLPERPHPLFDPTQDLAPSTELELAQIRDMAANAVENLQRTAIKMQDNAAEMGRWILASLLAMNTGGAVAVISASDKVVGPLGAPIVAFAIGAALAIGTGLNGLVTAARLGPVIGDVIDRLRLSVFEGVVHAATHQRALDMMTITRQQVAISSALAAGSLASFFLGVWAALT